MKPKAVFEATRQIPVKYVKWGLYPLSAYAPPLPPTYALPFTPLTALLTPICCDDLSKSGESFLYQPCLGLNLQDPPLTALFVSSNFGDLPDSVTYRNRYPVARRPTTTSTDHARRGGVHRSLKHFAVRRVLLSCCSVNSDLEKAQG